MLEPATHLPGTVLGGKFRIERVLGAGGMGVVYEVRHTVTRHRRALKLLHARMAANEEVVERFLREASAAGRIGNPHIVETFDGGHLPSGEPYVLLELLEGSSLAARLEGTSGLPVPDALAIVAQACDGTEAANRAGIIHRDLKPDNLFLVERDGGPFVKLLDFGVSRFGAQTSLDGATVGGGLIGTPFYMAPEQMRGESDLDARADVYALGVILWECLTNTLPYEARDVVRLVSEVLSDNEPRLDRVRPDLPRALVDVVAHAMRKPRDLRIGSAGELGRALRGLLGGLATARGTADPLAATLTPEPALAVRVSAGDGEVDAGAPTLAPVPASTPMSTFTAGPIPTSRPPRPSLPAEPADERSGPSRLKGVLLAVGVALVFGLAVIAVSGSEPTVDAGPADPPMLGAGSSSPAPVVGPEIRATPSAARGSASVAPEDSRLVPSNVATSPSSAPATKATTATRVPAAPPSARPASRYGGKGEFPGE